MPAEFEPYPGDVKTRLYARKPPAEYLICDRLGLIFQSNRPTVEEMARYADAEYEAGVYKDYVSAAGLKTRMFERRIAEIERRARGRRLLDVGCACGYFIETALKHGFDARGVELSGAAIAAARADIRPRITQGDVNGLAAGGQGSFDVVAAFDIIEHTQNPLAFLSQVRDLLAPGGLLALSTPDTDHFLRRLMGRRWPHLQPHQHLYLFSRRAMADVLGRAGFVNIELMPARKTLALDYLAGQIRIHNPLIHRLYRVIAAVIPRPLRERPFSVNIGEMIAFARRAPDAR